MTSPPPVLDALGTASYVLLTTFRRDGTPVPTPVWVARDRDSLVVWTDRAAGKVKRIRRDGAVTLVPCTFRGKPRGEPVPARAEILDAADTEQVRRLIKRKYRLTGPLTVGFSRRFRGEAATVGIRIVLSR
jgi:uncharacterized protein